ncbi:hypothetical protein [Luteolibacter soli]|uniref:Uncharacterized protein n=1 Tax=Luteolibacter soli TaxID=3135280 RepID=A0ABU9AWF6_9BACT
MSPKVIGAISGAILTPFTMLFAIVSAGAGHGDYILARILYPSSCLILDSNVPDSFRVPSICGLACIQLPIYGWVLGNALEKKQLPLTMGLMIGIHSIVAALTFR